MTAHIKNLEAFDRLVETIRTIDNSATSQCGFHMNYTAEHADAADHPCGTACCIGGWASVLTGSYEARPAAALSAMAGISGVDAAAICYPPDTNDIDGHPGWNATPDDAVALLLYYRKTGVVDWDYIMEVEQ